ncbi:nucleoside triphosphate pyrophosphohydrolase [Salimicrobium humidisoli]|uniref:Phosphoribosyl-ATP pyrophosphohydrolase n=1 Tax=Salimicrobium humidisoli TaxID=2029857 RepID=A0ABX4HVY5_9BACI|nr:nucleoside triphosphate pyrophosphohydrolase [Salimicrobium humidisoli]PBB06999.1 phosphoribosyl-ATP pyrophosphohydrolase [Salimicrobium humidisoli]
MPVHNKLVRDKIPEIIKNSNKKFTARILSETEYAQELKKKLYEEIEEYMTAENDEEAVAELADLSEIIYSLAKVHGKKPEDLEKLRKNKADQRGSFQEKIYLLEVED